MNGSGGATRTSVNRDFSPATINRSGTTTTATGSIRSDRNISGNTNVTANRNVSATQNINVNRNYDLDYDVDNAWHPVARGAAWAAGAAVTAAAIGSVAYALPPSCSTVIVGGVTYQQCGSSWYQPQYVGTSVQYVVVAPPQ